MKPAQIVNRVDELLALGEAVRATFRSAGSGASFSYADEGKTNGFRAAALSFIESQFGRSHTHYVELSRAMSGHVDNHVNSGIAILNAIRGEITGGWLSSVRSLVAAEIFSDFLEMATHLLESGYKDASAVILGSVLEEHLRQLAMQASIATDRETDDVLVPKKADLLTLNW